MFIAWLFFPEYSQLLAIVVTMLPVLVASRLYPSFYSQERYRIVYRVDEEKQVVDVFEIGHRSSMYRCSASS